ncbi:MAG: recombinase family protein [Candidatus Shapirobacteria bacterium]|nr:recombinase family protein [Candidatus Shapirobacteria bacterium]
MTTNKYFIYCRSAVITHDRTSSIKLQEEALVNYANLKELIVAGVFSDIGSSKAGLRKMLNAIKRKKANCILTTDISRISRDIKFFKEITSAFYDGKIEEIRIPPNVLRNDAESRMTLCIMSDFCNSARKNISDRIKRGIAAKKLRDTAKPPQN